MNPFKNGETKSEITYVVAKFSIITGKWFSHYEYEEIEDAMEKLMDCRKYHPDSTYGIFEKIKSQTINQISE